MRDIEHINDVTILKQLARLQEHEIKQLLAKLAVLTKKLAALEGQDPTEKLQRELDKLKGQLASHRRKLFGKSSERRRRPKPRKKKAKKTRTKFGRRAQPDLATETHEHVFHDDELGCVVCGGQLEPESELIEAGEEITVIERQYRLVRHVLRTYRCQCPETVTAPGPVKLMPRGRYSLDLAIQVAIDKYLHHMPLARQVREMKSLGLIIDTQTLWDQLDALARHLLASYELIRHYILGADVIGADETWWRLMKESSSKRWWVWAMSTHDAVFYRVDESRSSQAARRCLGTFKGVILCDGYAAYETLANAEDELSLAHCWAHVRRKFYDAHHAYPDECDQALDLLEKLFLIERSVPAPDGLEGEAKVSAFTQRAEVRQSKSRPILDDLKRWAKEQSALPESSLRKAIQYMLNQWEGLERFLDDPMIPLHNNHMEQELRNWVLGRKNHYGSRSQRGTEVAAIFYTVIETAKLCGVDPATYLRRAAVAAIEHPGHATLPHELIPPDG